jgi:hypothetical protein
VADDVGAVDPQMAHQRTAMARVIRHRQRPIDATARTEAGTVVAQQLVVGERRFVEERRCERGRHAPVDEHHGLARAPQLVGELDAVDGGPIHALPPRSDGSSDPIMPPLRR